MRHRRKGFSLLELLIVFVLVGVLSMIAWPRMGQMRETYRVQSAKQQVMAAITTARAAAVQKGRTARFRISGNVMSAVVSTGAADSAYVVQPKNLQQEFAVTIEPQTPGDTVVIWEARGFGRITDAPLVIRIRTATKTDSVCVGAIGQLMPRGCSL